MTTCTETVQSVDRALKILDALSEEYELGITELSRRTGLGKSTVHRLISTLHENEYVTQTAEGKYKISFKLFDIGNRLINRLGIRQEASGYLEQLAQVSKETVNLAVFDNDQVFYIDRIESLEPLRIGLELGRGFSAHCTALGKTWLAYISHHELAGYLARNQDLTGCTEHSISSIHELKVELQKIKEQGYTFDNEEYKLGIKCIAAPVFDYSGKIVAAVSISAPSIRMTHDIVSERIPQVMTIARKISGQLGFR